MSMKKLFSLVFLLFIPISLFAQTGKIAGVVTDKATGGPLVGVNVVLDNTTMGAMTDVDGYFVILNVPVSTYDIRASYVGYKDFVVKGIRVSSDVTTNQNFALEESVIEAEAVVVSAERPLVEKNITQSYSLVTAENIQSLPVSTYQAILALQPSVVVQDGNVHIRGGRSEEVGYYLDGASTANPLNSTQSLYIIPSALEEIQVLTGGYNAEYGGANSGIIVSQIKTGSSDYHATLDFQTDKFVSSGSKFLDTYTYQHHIATVSVSGPLAGNKIRFFLAGENNYQGDSKVRFSKGFEFDNQVDLNPNRLMDDTLNVVYPDGFTPRNKENRYAFNGSVIFDYSPIKVRLSGAYTYRRSYVDNNPMRNILRGRETYTDYNTYLVTANITHVLSPTTYYEINLSGYGRQNESGDNMMGKDWHTWYDSAAVNIPGAYLDAWTPNYGYQFNGIAFARYGVPTGGNSYTLTKQNYYSGALNLTSQIGKHHEVKVGGDARLYTIRTFSINPYVMRYTDASYTIGGVAGYGSIGNVPVDKWLQNGNVGSYGYDLYGNEISSDKNYGGGVYTNGPRKPITGSVYLQDKIEYNDLIVNAGLRLDYLDGDDYTLRDPADVKKVPGTNFVLKSEWQKIDPYVLVSPRLGFSFPVNEKTVFYMQYGKFAQLPTLNEMYSSAFAFGAQLFSGGFYYLNPIGYGLSPVKTTNYEAGFRKQISDYAAFDVSGFYRNVIGQLQVVKQTAGSGQSGAFNHVVNGDFATTKGLEFKLTLRRVNRIQATLAYTLTDAEGSGSNSTAFLASSDRGTAKPTVVSPLDYSQKHRGTINLDYRFGQNDGGVLQNSGASALFTFNSGHPFTYVYAPPGGQVDPFTAGVDYMFDSRSREALEPINSSTTPWNYNIDLRLDKSFNLTDKVGAMVYMRVNNLLNTKNVINVFQKTGSATDDGYLSNPALSAQNVESLGQTYVDMYKAIAIENGGAYLFELGNELFDHPRQIFFGIKLTY